MISEPPSPAVEASKIAVWCAHTRLVPVADLEEMRWPGNPNRHPAAQIDLLAHIIEKNGWRNPIVVSSRSNKITKGHGRLDAAVKKGWQLAPVDFQDYADEDDEKADLLADNRIAELSERDPQLVGELLHSFDSDFDLDLTGYDESARLTLLGEDDEIEPGTDESFLEKVCTDISDPAIEVHEGEAWRLGDHILVCSSILDPDKWIDLLGEMMEQPGDEVKFCPAPDPYLALSSGPRRLFLVQPDPYVASHCVSNFQAIHPDETSLIHGN